MNKPLKVYMKNGRILEFEGIITFFNGDLYIDRALDVDALKVEIQAVFNWDMVAFVKYDKDI